MIELKITSEAIVNVFSEANVLGDSDLIEGLPSGSTLIHADIIYPGNILRLVFDCHDGDDVVHEKALHWKERKPKFGSKRPFYV